MGSNCRDNIAKVVCLVDPLASSGGVEANPLDRPCLKGSVAYSRYFEAHYDRANPMIKKMYCFLERIWVEKSFFATAYATSIVDVPGGPNTGGAIGIRKETLDSGVDLDHWLTWKEETNFGGSNISSDSGLGILEYQSSEKTSSGFLDYVLDHEFGHLFDFANSLNKVVDCKWEKQPNGGFKQVGTCAYDKGSFGELSWTSETSPARPEDKFPGSTDLCFYNCSVNNHINSRYALELYSGLLKTNFISSYASSNALEDWAETFTSYLAYEERGLRLHLLVGNHQFDLRRHYYSQAMARKREFAQQFIQGSYKYPGEK